CAELHTWSLPRPRRRLAAPLALAAKRIGATFAVSRHGRVRGHAPRPAAAPSRARRVDQSMERTKSIRSWAGGLVALAGVVGIGVALLPGGMAPAQVAPPRSVYRVPVHGVIELGIAPFIKRSIREAEAAGAPAVILELETPGGRVDAAQQIVDAIKDAKVPVYAYVNRRALSAGAMIALATQR